MVFRNNLFHYLFLFRNNHSSESASFAPEIAFFDLRRASVCIHIIAAILCATTAFIRNPRSRRRNPRSSTYIFSSARRASSSESTISSSESALADVLFDSGYSVSRHSWYNLSLCSLPSPLPNPQLSRPLLDVFSARSLYHRRHIFHSAIPALSSRFGHQLLLNPRFSHLNR